MPPKGKGKGHGKAAAKGKSKFKAQHGDRAKTPDGREKCFAYNREGLHNQNCQRVHVCLGCNGPHPRSQCTVPPLEGGKGGK